MIVLSLQGKNIATSGKGAEVNLTTILILVYLEFGKSISML